MTHNQLQEQLIERLNLTPAVLSFTPWWFRWWCVLPVSLLCIGLIAYLVYRVLTRVPAPVVRKPYQIVVAECLDVDKGLADASLSGSGACVRLSGAVKTYLSSLHNQPLISLTDEQVVEHLRSMHNKGLVDTEFYGILELMLEDFYAVKFADQAVEVVTLRERIHQLVSCIELAAHQE